MKSVIKLLILRLLEEKGHSGYSIIKETGEKTGLKISTGSVYPILDEFLTKGIVEMVEKGRKKIYYLTEIGKKRVNEISKINDKIFQKMISEVMVGKIICGCSFDDIIEKLEEFKNADEE